MTFTAEDLAELLPDIYVLDADRILGWIREHIEGPRDGTAFIITVAHLIARALIDANPDVPAELPPEMFYALEFEFEKPPDNVARNTGQIVAAALNNDADMLRELAGATAWHADESVAAGVMVNLTAALSSALHALASAARPAAD